MAPDPKFPDRLGDRSDNAIDVAKQYAEENIGLRRQLVELQGICGRAAGMLRNNGIRLSNYVYPAECISDFRRVVDAALDELAKAE